MRESLRRRYERIEKRASEGTSLKSQFQNLHPQRQMLLWASLAGLVFLFLPWWESPEGYKLGIMSVGGVLMAVLFVAGLVLSWIKIKERENKDTMLLEARIGVAVLGVLCLILPWLFFRAPDPQDVMATFDYENTVICVGMYLSMIASFFVLASSAAYVPWFNGLKKDDTVDVEESKPRDRKRRQWGFERKVK